MGLLAGVEVEAGGIMSTRYWEGQQCGGGG